MSHRTKLRGSREPGEAASLEPHARHHARLAGLALLTAAPIVIVAALVPRALVLPSVSLTAIAIGALTALAAWTFRTRHRGNTVTLWDIAGAFVLIGCAAAIFSQPEKLLQHFG